MLGPSIDTQDAHEDVRTVVDGVPFIASNALIDEYGENFALRFEEGRLRVHKL